MQLSDVDGLIGALKACLRSPNQHLSAATLAALPPFLQVFATGKAADSDEPVDAYRARLAMTAFLPTGGGLLDRLGDNRERSREKARESLVILGGLALRCGSSLHMSGSRVRDVGKGPETPMMIWERFLREGGLQSKVWRVREQV